MKTNIATTQDQSSRLLECGVSADTADMSIDIDTECIYPYPYNERVDKPYETPAWSLSALCELIPHVIEVDDDTECYFCLAKDYPASEDYSAAYLECWTLDHESIVHIRDNSSIEACVQLIEWLTSNGYKLNEQ